MLTKFLEGLSGKVAEKWQVGGFLPVLLFWSGGLCVLVSRRGWRGVVAYWTALPESAQIMVGITTALVLVLTAVLASAIDLRVLRLLEGYWPWPLSRLRRPILERQGVRYAATAARYQLLSLLAEENLTAEDLAELTRIEEDLKRIPSDPKLRMPTRIGNSLRAAELRPGEKYGLHSTVCWPRIWLLLPDTAAQQLVEARNNLDVAVRAFLFASLFLIWAVWAWWTAPLSLLSMFVVWGRIVDAADVYADLQESTFDVYRFLLYQALRWPLPHNPEDERAAGKAISTYLFRGSDERVPRFTRT